MALGTSRALVVKVTRIPVSSLTVSWITPDPSTQVLPDTPISDVELPFSSKEMKSSLNGEIIIDAPVSKGH